MWLSGFIFCLHLHKPFPWLQALARVVIEKIIGSSNNTGSKFWQREECWAKEEWFQMKAIDTIARLDMYRQKLEQNNGVLLTYIMKLDNVIRSCIATLWHYKQRATRNNVFNHTSQRCASHPDNNKLLNKSLQFFQHWKIIWTHHILGVLFIQHHIYPF